MSEEEKELEILESEEREEERGDERGDCCD